MSSLHIWLSMVLLLVPVQGYNHSQDEPCENMTQWDSGNRIRFVGNLSSNDLSIMIEQLSREDTGHYRCRVELNVGKFETPRGTNLTVEAAGRNDSVVSGTEGDSVTLPCMFTPNNSLTLTTVTWLRKEPYQHVVTFRAQSSGSWAAVNAVNRYKFAGNPKKGDMSIRINELNVEDNHTYLCLVEYTGSSDYQYLIQNETQVHVTLTDPTYNKYLLLIPLLILLPILFIIFIIFMKKGGCSRLKGCTRSLKRKDPGSSMTARTDQAHQKSAPEQGDSSTYAEIDSSRTGGKRFTISASEDSEPGSCTYASIVIGSNRKVQGGRNLTVAESEENVTYAAVSIR
ncbi:uncharacterized protein LOC144692089 [Cetorhinus maximus]